MISLTLLELIIYLGIMGLITFSGTCVLCFWIMDQRNGKS